MYLELAQKYLVKARATSGSTRQYFANLCQVCLAKEGASPEDIKTTQQELVGLQAKIFKKSTRKGKRIRSKPKKDNTMICKKYLQNCREAQGASRQYYANLCLATLAKFDMAPETIGTSKTELENLQRKGFLESAINYLSEARNAVGTKRKCYADLCWEYLSKAKASPADIGSSEEELHNISL